MSKFIELDTEEKLRPRTIDNGPETRVRRQGTGDKGPETGDQGPETRDRRQGTGDKGPETRDWRPETRDRRPGTGDQGPDTKEQEPRAREPGTGYREPKRVEGPVRVELPRLSFSSVPICSNTKYQNVPSLWDSSQTLH